MKMSRLATISIISALAGMAIVLGALLISAESEVAALEDQVSALRSPRHFKTITELTDWLAQDDTDTAYPGKSSAELAFILQVKALRDGYLVSGMKDYYGTGWAAGVVGNAQYALIPTEGEVYTGDIAEPVNMPLYPLPLE